MSAGESGAASGLEQEEILLACIANGLKGNSAVECYKSSLVLHGDPEQVHVGNLPWTVDSGCIEHA